MEKEITTQSKIDLISSSAISSIFEVISSDNLSPQNKIVAIEYLVQKAISYIHTKATENLMDIATSW